MRQRPLTRDMSPFAGSNFTVARNVARGCLETNKAVETVAYVAHLPSIRNLGGFGAPADVRGEFTGLTLRESQAGGMLTIDDVSSDARVPPIIVSFESVTPWKTGLLSR